MSGDSPKSSAFEDEDDDIPVVEEAPSVLRSRPTPAEGISLSADPSLGISHDPGPYPGDGLELIGPGTRLDEYVVVERLGQGGMGSVFKAIHTVLKRDVALKVISPHMARDRSFKARFLREAKIAMEFVHRHAVPVRDFGETKSGLVYMTMDLIRGSSLRAIMRASGRLPPARACRIARQMLEALGEAHRKKIVHRDLKPDNVMVETDEDGLDFVKVLDFGLAKIVSGEGDDASSSVSTGQTIVGTPAYMAPEQAAGEPHVDHRADLYSCGIVLFQMLTGQQPFKGDSARQLIMKQISAETPEIGEIAPDLALPEGLEPVVRRALEKDPTRRWQTAEEFFHALEPFAPTGRFESRSGVAAVGDAGPRPGRRTRWKAPGAALVLVLGAAVFFAARRGPPRRPQLTQVSGSARASTSAVGTSSVPPGAPEPPLRADRELPTATSAPAPPRSPREVEADEALAAVGRLEGDHPGAYHELIGRYRELARRFPFTGAAAEADARAERLEAAREAAASSALGAVRAEIARATAAGSYGEALAAAQRFPIELQGARSYDAALAAAEQVKVDAAAAWTRARDRVLGEGGLRERGHIALALAAVTPFAAIEGEDFAALRAEAEPLEARLRLLESLHRGMVLVPSGTAIIGSDRHLDNERPAHRVALAAFYIDATEVPAEDYARFLDDEGRALGLPDPLGFVEGKPRTGEGRLPVVGVTRDEAASFARWSGKRLPTEEEWERAARGADGRAFPWGEEWDVAAEPLRALIRPTGGRERGRPLAVDSHEYDNGCPAGILHLAGNVAEWTSSTYRHYEGNPHPRAERGLGTYAVVKGGDFETTIAPTGCRGSFRVGIPREQRSSYLGFRCVKSAE